jgi:hypothetical protein
VEKVGQIPVLYPGGYPGPNFTTSSESVTKVAIVLNPTRRRAYELFKLTSPTKRLAIRAFDLDTFKPLGPGRVGTPGYGEIPGSPTTAQPQGIDAAEWVYALDDAGGHLFVPIESGGIVRIDLAALDRGAKDFAFQGPPAAVRSLFYYTDLRSGKGKLLAAGPSVIWRADALSLQEEWVEGHPTIQCPSFYAKRAWPPIWRSSVGNYLYMVCTGDTNANAFQPRLVRIGVDPAQNDKPNLAETRAFPGPTDGNLQVALADPATDRVSMVTHDPNKGFSVWVLDARGEALAGTAAFLPQDSGNLAWSYGLDQTSGRLYTFAQDYVTSSTSQSKPSPRHGGLFLFDNRLTPISQGLQFPEFAYPSLGRIQVDPLLKGERRIVVRRGSIDYNHRCFKYPSLRLEDDYTSRGGCPPDHFFTVYADRIPIPRQPVPADLDINTQGVQEAEGKTERTFEASGGAYGIRARLVGGMRGATAHDIANPNNQLYYDGAKADVINLGGLGETNHLHQPGRFVAPACWATDREAVSARVEDAIVSQHEATASAWPLQADPSTQEDQRAPASRCRPMITPYQLPPPNIAKSQDLETTEVPTPPYERADRRVGSEWTLKEASCSGDDQQSAGVRSLRTIPTEVDEEVQGQEISAFKDQNPAEVALPASHPGFAAQSSCYHEYDAADAGAYASPVTVGVAGEVSVGESTATVNITRLDKGGVKVVSYAEAKGIRIGDVYIEAVRTLATSVAKGRQGGALTSFSRTICGVSFGAGEPSPCYTATKDPSCLAREATKPKAVQDLGSVHQEAQVLIHTPTKVCADPLRGIIDQINTRLAGTPESRFLLFGSAEVILRDPEPSLAKGTPGGYIAGIQKREAQVINDSLILRDFTREIPGLEITTYRDSNKYGVARQVIQLAGVRATTSYGTLCLPPLVPQAGECKQGPDLSDDSDAFGGVIPEPPAPGPVLLPTDSPTGNEPAALGPTGLPTAPPAPPVPSTPIGKARAFLVRSFGEGIFGTGVWLALGLPVYLGTRRFTLTKAFPR